METLAVTNLLLLRIIKQGGEPGQVGPDGNPTASQLTLAVTVHELSRAFHDEAVRSGIQALTGKYAARLAGNLAGGT